MPDDVFARARVKIWAQTVGALVERSDGRIFFEYTDQFRQLGLEISPIHLPTDLKGPQVFDDLLRTSFRGLPGVFADAGPDSFARKVIRAYHEGRGESKKATSPIQHLLYIGDRSIGALSFHPTSYLRSTEGEILELKKLVEEVRSVIKGKTDVAIPELYSVGVSAGGKRPKAVVNYHPEKNELRAGIDDPRNGEIPCILKFDGVGDDASEENFGEPKTHNRVEAAYGDMARDAGIIMPEINPVEAKGYYHLLIPRFDITETGYLHQHTLGGLIHVDYNDVGASSYEEYFRVIQQLGMGYDALEEGFRRMVFNDLSINFDDHVKNLSFHMDKNGEWSLTPAYDLTYCHGQGFTRSHQMLINDKREGVTDDDLLKTATEIGLKHGKDIIRRVRSVVNQWPSYATKHGIDSKKVKQIQRDIQARNNLPDNI